MIQRDKLSHYLSEYLEVEAFSDYAPNGLQIQGKQNISTICTAVTASLDVICKAIQFKADALLVHHGYFWKGEDTVIHGMKRERIKSLLINDINLFAYHLPLDAHPVIGNNACIGNLLNLKRISCSAIGKNKNMMWLGQLKNQLDVQSFSVKLNEIFQRKPEYVSDGVMPVSKIAWCSGAAQDYIIEANSLGADTYISGEISERTFYQAKELNMNYFACGHHATERFGIHSLGNYLAHHFNLTHHFIDSDNPY